MREKERYRDTDRDRTHPPKNDRFGVSSPGHVLGRDAEGMLRHPLVGSLAPSVIFG